MSKPKNQHIIPQCYLKQFVDSKTPSDQEPYVWIFDKENKKGKKKAPKNILSKSDFYTLTIKIEKFSMFLTPIKPVVASQGDGVGLQLPVWSWRW